MVVQVSDNKTMYKSNIDWASLYFTAESDCEEYKDVRIITAHSAFLEALQERALSTMTGNSITDKTVREEIIKNHSDYIPTIMESVSFNEDEIVVIIDADAITDQVVDQALEMVAYACGKGDAVVNFGKPLVYDKAWVK